MSTTTNMVITLPDVSVTAGPTWATNYNTAFTTIDAHDHTSGKGVKVTPAGLNINATFEMNSNDITEINAAAFDNQAAIDTTARSLQVVSGELWFRDNASNSVQITNNGALSALSFAEIGGDYATSTAAIVYSTSTKFFTFTQSAGVGAKLSIGSIAINDAAGGANAGTLVIPALGAAATYTLPSATATISTLALSETLTNKTLSAPVLSGSVTGTYTLAGTPTLTSPAINTATIAGGTATGLTKLGLRASGDDFDLVIAPQSQLTAERTLSITTGDAASAISIEGTASVINQDVTSDASVTFAGLQANGAITVGVDDTGYDVTLYGATSGKACKWDQANDQLKLDKIAEYTSAAGVTVDSLLIKDAALNFTAASKGTFQGLEAIQYYLPGNTGTVDPINPASGTWTKTNSGMQIPLGGTGVVTVDASGYFTLVGTGYWLIIPHLVFVLGGADAQASLFLQGSQNGGAYSTISYSTLWGLANKEYTLTFTAVVKATTSSADKVKLVGSAVTWEGTTGYAYGGVTFIKLANI